MKKKFSSKYTGVRWDKQKWLWEGRITLDGRSVSLGYFHTELQAAMAHDLLVVAVNGKLPRYNFVGQVWGRSVS